MSGCSVSMKYIAEFLGTAFLIIVGVGTVVLSHTGAGFLGIAFAFGLTLMVLIYLLGPISGCHINPGVTFASLLTGKLDYKMAAGYVVAQLMGGIFGAWIIFTIAMGKADLSGLTHFASTGYNDHSPEHYSSVAVMLAETILTTILITVVLAATHCEKYFSKHSGIIIGSTLTVITLVALPVSGASFNFARSLGTAVFEPGKWAMGQLWLFLLTQILAGLISVVFYKQLACSYNECYKKDGDKDHNGCSPESTCK